MNNSQDTRLPSIARTRIREALAQVPTIGEPRSLTIVTRICGVYLLCEEEEIVYIGQSKDIVARVNQHIDEHIKDFDGVLYIRCAANLLDYFEKCLISLMRPRYNFAHVVKRLGAADLVVHALSHAPDGLTFDEVVTAAERQKVWAQTDASLRANLRHALDANPRIKFHAAGQRYRIQHPAVEVRDCQNRENFSQEPF
jgi:hypothetical protein